METLLQDLRYGIRMLMKRPGFTAVSVITLALGIGANTAIFSVVDAVMLRPLPYKDSERLVVMSGDLHRPGLEEIPLSAPEYLDYAQSGAFEEIAAYDFQGFNLTGGDEPERLLGGVATASLFPLLGVQPARGRVFSADEDQPGRDQVVVLSHGLWVRRFNSDPDIAGKLITLDDKSFTILGVMPAGFNLSESEIELWKPVAFSPDLLTENNRGSHFLTVLARLKSGTGLRMAQAELNITSERVTSDHRATYPTGFAVSIKSLHEEVVGNARSALFLLLAAVGFVLLIACTNVANLMLARAATREKEVSIRLALGASRFRLIRQLLTESALLAVLGGTVGLLLALWGVDLLVTLSPAGVPRIHEIGINGRIAGFTLLVSLLTSLIFGLAPALQVSKPALNESLKEGARGVTAGRRRQLLRSSLVVLESALSLVLLIGAGLLIRSFSRVNEVDPGFKPDHLLSVRLYLPQAKYPEFSRGQQFFETLFERLREQNGIEAVGAINAIPFGGSGDRTFFIEGRPVGPQESPPDEQVRFVSANYFTTMVIPLLKGREFTDRDGRQSPRVAVINRALAERYWPGEDPLGRRVAFRQDEPTWYEIVGVVGNVKHRSLEGEEKPELYVPFLQPLFASARMPSMFLVVRSSSDPLGLAPLVRHEVMAIDKDQPISDIKTMDQRMSQSIAQRHFNMVLLGIFAGVALVLAAVGIYGVTNYAVTQRMHEIGIRIALGAQSSNLFRLVIKQALMLVSIGVAAGIAAAIPLTALIKSLLF
ncbi:MAG TPA: ABC transporter permease, partial [Blastocatellia bacterium]|nr:ABC transporter permease [Blastocatellia bacterium]